MKLVVRDFVSGVDLKATTIGSMDIGGVQGFIEDFLRQQYDDRFREDAGRCRKSADPGKGCGARLFDFRPRRRSGRSDSAAMPTRPRSPQAITIDDNWTAHIDQIKVKGSWTNGSINAYLGPKSDQLQLIPMPQFESDSQKPTIPLAMNRRGSFY